MNRRVILIDCEETTDYVKYYGCGLGNEIYTLQFIESLPEEEKRELLLFSYGDAIMLVGSKPFSYLQNLYHFGVRNENYSDCSKLRRLSIEGGAFVKCIHDFPTQQEIVDFLSPEFTKPKDFSWFKQKILHTYNEVMRFFDWIDTLPIEEDLGFDYETSGMPLDKVFYLSGASICNINYGGFISFTDLRRSCSSNEYNKILSRLSKILLDRMSHIWTFNMQYEFQVSHRELGVDLYNLCDASVVNVLDGNHFLKKYSLKWTAQMVLDGVITWDVDFDKLSDLMDSMFFEVVGKLKKERKKVIKVTPDTYQYTNEWKEICRLYPNYIKEFEQLILEYWGLPFMCIPSEILGYYCNLDSFYTLMIYKSRENVYSKDAFQTFLDNIRLGARLHSSGLYIDEPYRLQYKDESLKLMAWGITYCASARCKIKMNKHSKLMRDINKYNPIAKKLLEFEKFYNGNELEIAKSLLLDNLDKMDAYESGLNEGQLFLTYGNDFAESFINIVKESIIETKFKGKIDETIWRKKKIMGVIAEKLKTLIGLDKIKINTKHIELEKFIFYKNAYEELIKVSKNQLFDINNIPNSIYIFGKNYSLEEYSEFISNTYFKCKSPIENDTIITEMYELYKTESSFIAALSESVQQLPCEDKDQFFKSLGFNSIEESFKFFMSEWEKYCYLKENEEYSGPFPIKIFNIALECWRKGIEFSPAKDVYPIKDVWSDFSGVTTQSQFFPEYNQQYIDYGNPFKEEDLQNNFFFMRKFTVNYLLYKKYSKVLSTYIDGMFKKNNKWVIEGEDHIPLREADPNEPGAIEKCFVHYEVNTKSSKRWSSGFHTIISHSDLKDCLMTPYHYSSNGERIVEDFFETYFDISSAEVNYNFAV